MTDSAARAMAVKIGEETRERLNRVAQSRKRTPHWLAREAIEQYLEREECRLSFHEEALKSWAEYKTTGLHVTHKEADTWLEKLENGEIEAPPECHK